MLTTALGSVFSQTAPLKFVQEHQKFGKIEEGKELYLTYEFVNEGEKPIIFNEAKVNCTCTVVTFPKEPINPKAKGVINIGFHTKGKIGFQERSVELITNQGNYTISFKGTVKATEETKEQYKESHNHAH
jgi:hypothetical protein